MVAGPVVSRTEAQLMSWGMSMVAEIEAMSARINGVLKPLLARGSSYALLDFPTHTNIGDSAIYAGEMAVLDRIVGGPASHVSTLRSDTRYLREIPRKTVLLLHGGGNFGDIWLPYQRYREAVLKQCSDHKIIQLAQSLHFRDEKNRDTTARAIAAHPNFTLLVRDRRSLALARAHFECETHLCPDMAYGLQPVAVPDVPVRHRTLCLMREDVERKDDLDLVAFKDFGELDDWPVHSDPLSLPARVAFRLATNVAQGPMSMKIRERAFRRYANWMTGRGLRFLSSAERVVTDRLHGHILCSLLGKPHVALDNSYGKISTFIDAWPKDPFTWTASDLTTTRIALDGMPQAA